MTKVVILAGGLGTRLSEETESRAKPMVEIGGMPIIWHIMKHYGHHGFREFVIACGYRQDGIKRFFLDYRAMSGSVKVGLKTGAVEIYDNDTAEDWLVHLVDTGQHTNTGGRVKRLQPILAADTFLLTYGDGVSDVDLEALLAFHRGQGRIATVTAVRPPARFGGLVFDGNLVANFSEKPQVGEGWINGGFMVLEPGIFEYLRGDDASFERDALEPLAAAGQLVAFKHERFWQCMDTLRDLRLLESLWEGKKAPWRVWA